VTSFGDKAEESSARAPTRAPLPATAAHEINSPLEALLGLLHLVEAEPTLTAEGRHYLTLAQEEVRRISEIARDTLGEHRIIAKAEKTNVCELLSVVLDFYKQRLDSLGITVRAEYSGEVSIPVYTGQLRQLFSNLLLNAIEAMPRGGKIRTRVYAGHEWCGHQRRGVRVTVGDDGSGIPQSMLPQVFQQFFTMKPAGHGVGLSLVKDIVQKHKGRLHVRSSTQPTRHGTVFSLFLPTA
jgi:signal transduction histidine kinase